MVIVSILILSFVTAIYGAGEGDRDWSYINGSLFLPDNWHKAANSSLCNGARQSGIDLQYSIATYDKELKEIKLSDTSSTLLLRNSGTTVQVDFETAPTYTFGGTGTVIKVVQMHWHWGETNAEGSEHTLEGSKFPIEIHFVGFDSKYADLQAAAAGSDSLYVLGIFYEIGAENSALKPIIDEVKNVLNYGQNKTLTKKIKIKDVLPNNLSKYYQYLGSLTTPPCLENVIWTVFDEKLTMSSAQVAEFRESTFGPPETSNKMVKNFRPINPLTKAQYAARKFKVSWSKDSRKIGFSISIMVFFTLTAIWRYWI